MLEWLKDLFFGKEEPVVLEAKQKPQPAKAKKDKPVKKAADLSGMTKTQLLEYAKQKGIKVNSSMKKADIVKAING